jgi:hypothetical protein
MQFAVCNYIIRYCSSELVTLHCARCIMCYCIAALMICNLHCRIILCSIAEPHCKFFRMRKTYKFSLFLCTRIQTFLPFQGCGGKVLAVREDLHSDSGHSFPVHLRQIRQTALLSRNSEFWNWYKSIIKTLTTEQSFRYSHCHCTAETSLVGQQRKRNCSVQSAGLTVGWFQVLCAVLLLYADGSVLVGCDAVPDASKGRIASIFRVKSSC